MGSIWGNYAKVGETSEKDATTIAGNNSYWAWHFVWVRSMEEKEGDQEHMQMGDVKSEELGVEGG